ncbi:unnamed protein product [Penicillium salamii]|uniref:Uncharacterized protein n=1 Tax=Penicillium salamii TaxID=1612424 RepID=A0A9W4I3N0_9EURO|nr:unnamed protein product [Penicillium salamii]CAG8260568.1 unnamed protein product [Penicillium salamii]CAG8390067.1 unnamed protein product [Penicillium salamii]CAG8426812.1 unnamed protein product [Penicillium salamii]
MASFPPWEAVGNQIRKWTENPREPNCKIARITLTLDTLPPKPSDWDVDSEPNHLDPEHYKWLENVGIATDVDKKSGKSVYRGTIVMKTEGALTSWTGMTGPGVIFINKIDRARESKDPYMSEITHAVYTKDFNLAALKHIWVTDVKNEDTARFINTHVYAAGLEARYPRNAIISWTPADAQYNALLGTALGKMVGYFVLGAFGQGVKRISKISIFRSFDIPQLQFDIANV